MRFKLKWRPAVPGRRCCARLRTVLQGRVQLTLLRLFLFSLIMALGGASVGGWVVQYRQPTPVLQPDVNLGPKTETTKVTDSYLRGIEDPMVFHLVRSAISRHHLDAAKLPREELNRRLYYGSISGMVGSLTANDPHSAFYDPEEAEMVRGERRGQFAGIGVVIRAERDRVKVVSVLDDSAALDAGIKAGDEIVTVDDRPVTGLPIIKVAMLIRGPDGMPVRLKLHRPATSNLVEATATRRQVNVESVKLRFVNRFGRRWPVMTISEFDMQTLEQFQRLSNQVRSSQVDGLVVDLRNNHGGSLGITNDILGAWIGQRLAVKMVYVDQRVEEVRLPREPAIFDQLPTVVLVNGESASGAEIMAAVLREYGKAKIVGEKTFGKGVGQQTTDFSDGSRLELTTFYWQTAGGQSIHKVGVQPNVVVPLTAEDRSAGRDSQLDRALSILAGRR